MSSRHCHQTEAAAASELLEFDTSPVSYQSLQELRMVFPNLDEGVIMRRDKCII